MDLAYQALVDTIREWIIPLCLISIIALVILKKQLKGMDK